MSSKIELQKAYGKVIELKSEDVRLYIKENEMTILDFYSNLCPPCKRMQPFLEELAEKFEGKVAFAKINAKEEPAAMKEFQIIAFPSFYFFYRGVAIAFFIGEKKKEDFEYLIKLHFKSLVEN